MRYLLLAKIIKRDPESTKKKFRSTAMFID